MTGLTSIDLYRLELPLAEPYHLSHTTVQAFETVLVDAELADGRRGLGEATPLEGYSAATASEVWTGLRDVASRVVGDPVDNVRDYIESEFGNTPFARTALDCAVETATLNALPSATAPVVGILSTNMDSEEMMAALGDQLEQGFETIKVKVGFDPEQDAARLANLVDAAPSDIAFRVDANQGFSLAEARRFFDAAPLESLQLVEQPLPVGNLDDHAKLTAAYDVAVMLDEEVRNRENLELIAKREAADAVKFKLMKAGGWASTRQSIERAQELGFKVVLGNGVQSGVGCIHEALLWQACGVELAGEFNGWLKQESNLVDGPLDFHAGALSWDGGQITIDDETVAANCINTLSFRA